VNRAVKTLNRHRTDSAPLRASVLAREAADNDYPHIPTSALRMLANMILKKAHMNLPVSNRAACVAVIRGIRGERKAVRRGTQR
jgi:hypothetical protein